MYFSVVDMIDKGVDISWILMCIVFKFVHNGESGKNFVLFSNCPMKSGLFVSSCSSKR